MPLAITLRADRDDALPLRELHDAAIGFSSEPIPRRLEHAPHITLAIYEGLPARDVEAAASRLFKRGKALALRFKAVRWFDGADLTLYAAPEPSLELDELHALLHRLIAPENCHPHYRPGSFVPHCTLSASIPFDRQPDAIAFARRMQMSFLTKFTKGDMVSFPPPRVLREWRLAAMPQNARR